MDYDAAIREVETAGGLVDLNTVIRYARALEMRGKPDQAVAIIKQLHDETPTEALACQYAATLCRLGYRDQEGLDALMLRYPDCQFLRAAKSEMALNDGDYQTGFALCGYRWAASSTASYLERIRLPYWEGQDLEGRLIVIGEQGIGEEILYSSSFHLIPPSIISADLRLQPLLSRSFPQHVFVDKSVLHHYHGEAVVEAMDLCRIFNRIGNERSWLKPDLSKVMAYRKAMQEAFPGRNLIGLSWASARKGLSESKSVPITDLLPLMQSPDLACFNVQYGDTTGDTQAAIDAGGKFYAIGNIDLTNDQDELAAMIGALDAVVTCSNSVAHLSAALGVRTILLAPGGRFVLWYWMREGDRTPWYPAMEIIRAKSGWPAAVVEALRKVSITEVVPWRDAGWL